MGNRVNTMGELTTELRNEKSAKIDSLSTREMLELINSEDHSVADAVAKQIPIIAEAVDRIASRIQDGGRLFYIGAGTSGRLGVLDASECGPTYNTHPDMVQGIIAGGYEALWKATEASEDLSTEGRSDLDARGATGKDVVCGIAASGRTPYVLGAIDRARELGALTIGISCVAKPVLTAHVDISINPITGPEVVTGSTRMKAGTATKLILNMLSTGTMIRLGMTFGNLMVNVQPRNKKLVDRAQRIIAEAVGVDQEEAARLLEASGRSVRTAIVMSRLNLAKEEAEQRLASYGNVVARALGEN